jgi:hypothetical protein
VPLVPEKSKRPGVLYAYTETGVELPVVDVTNPAFALEMDEAHLPMFAAQQLKSMEKWSRVPAFLRNWFARNSVLMGASSQGSVLDGMTTYLYKLGPDNLGAGYTKRMDQRVAANVMSVAVRQRFRDIARLIADGLLPPLKARPGPVTLLNLAGGTAMDSLNALILVHTKHPEILLGRSVYVQVLDPDRAGFVFAGNALTALTRDEDGPLRRLEISLAYREYNWGDTSSLLAALRGADSQGRADEQVIVASSEGGIFEYASDAEILKNLEVLHEETPPDFVIVGSALKDEPLTRMMKKMSGTTFLPRKLDDLAQLAERAGWRMSTAGENNPVYHVIGLSKVPSGR